MTPSATLAVEALSRQILDGFVGAEGQRGVRADLGILPVFSDERPLQGLAGLVDWRSSGKLSRLIREGFCTGAQREQVLTLGADNLPAWRWVVCGMGDSGAFDAERAAQVGRSFVEIAEGVGAGTVLAAIPSELTQRDRSEALFEALVARLGPLRLFEPAASDGSEALEGPRLAGEDELDRAPGGAEAPDWWVTAAQEQVVRLRRLVSGPPRAAHPGAAPPE